MIRKKSEQSGLIWVSSEGKVSACNAGDLGSIPGSGRSPGEGNGNPLQYSCLENPMDGEAWQATVHGVAKSRTQLSNFTSLYLYMTRFLAKVLLSNMTYLIQIVIKMLILEITSLVYTWLYLSVFISFSP